MTQTTMPLAEVLELHSGDFGIPMTKVMEHMDGQPCVQGGSTCEDHILSIAESMETEGWTGPPVCVVMEPPGWWRASERKGFRPYVADGHHRTMAAWLVGLEEVPVTGSREVSDDAW